MKISEDYMWKAVAAGSTVLAAMAMRSALKLAWKAVKKEEPPENPASPDTAWGEALVFTAAMGLAVGIARLIAERGAAEGWRKYYGALPKELISRKS